MYALIIEHQLNEGSRGCKAGKYSKEIVLPPWELLSHSPPKKRLILEWLLHCWQYHENMYFLIIEHQLSEGLWGCRAGKYPKEIFLLTWETILPPPQKKEKKGIPEWFLLYWQYFENMYALIIEHQLSEGSWAARLRNIPKNIFLGGKLLPPPSKKGGILEWLLLNWQYYENIYALIIEHQLNEGLRDCKAGKYSKEIVLPPWETIAPSPPPKKERNVGMTSSLLTMLWKYVRSDHWTSVEWGFARL